MNQGLQQHQEVLQKAFDEESSGVFFFQESDTSTPPKTNMEPSEIIQKQYFIHDLDLLSERYTVRHK